VPIQSLGFETVQLFGEIAEWIGAHFRILVRNCSPEGHQHVSTIAE
jgi:hypothetical protein